MERKNKRWKKAENEELKEMWLSGRATVEKMAITLGRTPDAVREHAYRLGLPSYRSSRPYLCYKNITDCFGYDSKAAYTLFKTLPAIKRKNGKQLVNAVSCKVFWKWAYENKDKIDFSKYELGSIDDEPKWVREEVKKSKRAKSNTWTKLDDNMLITYYTNGKSLEDIAKKLGRTYNSVGHRASKLCKTGKLKHKKIYIRWTAEEVKQLKEMRDKGMTYEQCAYELGRDMTHIADKLRRIN